MKGFFKKLLLFIIPFVLYVVLIVLTDPYNYWNHNKIIPLEVKLTISRELNGRLWKVVQFNRTPKPNVMFGDSRVDMIDTKRMRDITGADYYNFGYPSATLQEIIETFWYVANKVELKNVIMGISFNLYNKYNNKDLISPVLASSNEVRYVLNGANIKAVVACFYQMAKGGDAGISVPDMDFESFWQEKIDGPSAQFYKLYKYPDNYYHELKEISDYCKAHGINLVFYIPPTHVDLQAQIEKYHLSKEAAKYRSDLEGLGKVLDFDYPTWFTSEKEHFSDPFHFNVKLDTIIFNALVNQESAYARVNENTGG